MLLLNQILRRQTSRSHYMDMIGNELLKTAQTYLNPCLVKLFNAVFTSGIYPQIWSESRQENDLNSGFCSNSFTFLFSSSIFCQI
jgi:hypothetical protein